MLTIYNHLTVFCGHFGSGKTEVALNYIINKTSKKSKVIIDLDIVNPFFKASDSENVLNESGIELIKPLFANTNVEVPSLSPKVDAYIYSGNFDVVIDVGGDDIGAKILSRYSSQIINRGYNMYCVVNTNRIFTQNYNSIIKMINEIETSSRLKIIGLINNTNLLNDTIDDDILIGQEIIEKVALTLNKPVFLTTIMGSKLFLKRKIQNDIMRIKKYVITPIDHKEAY